MTKVWITRTQRAADKTAEAVRRLGFDPVISPLLKVTPPRSMPDMPTERSILVFTSSNGVRMFCALTDRRSWAVVTVGDATADTAINAGFTDVQSASGTSADVTSLIKRHYKSDTPVTHCCGNVVRGTISEDLRAAGYPASRSIFYESMPMSDLPKLKDVRYVLLHSPLAAETLSAMGPDCAHVIAICMSEAVTAALGALALREILIANAPTQTALLACLTQ